MRRLLKIYRNRNYVWPADVTPPPRLHEHRPIHQGNIAETLALRDSSVARTFARFIDEGRFGVFCYLGGVAVGHAWVTPPVERPQVANTYAKLSPMESLIHYCYVAPEHRGRGLYAQMLQETTAWALAAGANRIRVDTSEDNVASQRGIERAGFVEVSPTTSIVVGRLLLATKTRDQPERL